jgi:hypothetical protein
MLVDYIEKLIGCNCVLIVYLISTFSFLTYVNFLIVFVWPPLLVMQIISICTT